MAKSGHKKGKGILHGDGVTPEELIQDMKQRSSTMKMTGRVAGMDFHSDTKNGRPYIWMMMPDGKVKKYIERRDIHKYSPDMVFYDKAPTEKDKVKTSELPDINQIPND